jgi:hypothetical protein
MVLKIYFFLVKTKVTAIELRGFTYVLPRLFLGIKNGLKNVLKSKKPKHKCLGFKFANKGWKPIYQRLQQKSQDISLGFSTRGGT